MPLTKTMLLEMADANRVAGLDSPDKVHELIRTRDLVFCVWRDPDAREGAEQLLSY